MRDDSAPDRRTQECATLMSPKGHTAERRRGPGWRSHDSRGAPIRHSLAEVSRAVYHESGDKEIGEEIIVANYIPSPRQWVREQVELYEGSGGKERTPPPHNRPPGVLRAPHRHQNWGDR